MAHFAKIGINGKVIGVHSVNNKDILNADGVEEEAVGQQYLEKHSNWPAEKWIQTSYNTSGGKHYDNETRELSADQSKALRGTYAGIGFTWDEDNNIFYPQKPYASWVLNTTTASWHSPIGDEPALTAEQQAQNEVETHGWGYAWNEANQSWDLSDSKV